MVDSIQGVGPDAPIITNAQGAKQSRLDYAFEEVDGPAFFGLARVLDYGAKKYGPGNWRGIPERDHLRHVIAHAYLRLMGDESDDHIGHMQCRAHMAMAKALEDGYVPRQADEGTL